MPKRSRYSASGLARMMTTAQKMGINKIKIGGQKRFFRSRRASARRSMVAPSRNRHSFKRYAADVRVNTTGTTSSHAITYTFQNMVQSSDFTDLYDRYMITCIVHKFRLVNNPDAAFKHNNEAAQVWNTSNFFPKLWYCPDYDDANTETLQQRAQTKCVVLRPNQHYKVVVKPAVTIQAYRTALSTGYAPKWRQWIDMGDVDVPHYGLKFVVDTSAQDPVDTQPLIVEYTTQYYFTCKDVR